MSNFYVNVPSIEAEASIMQKMDTPLKLAIDDIISVKANISLSNVIDDGFRDKLQKIADKIQNDRVDIGTLTSALIEAAKLYKDTETKIVSQERFSDTKDEKNADDADGDVTSQDTTTATDINDNTADEETEMSFEEAIDFLNGLSMSTSIDGEVLALIKYILDLLDSSAASTFGNLGNAAGVVGTVVGIAADVMYALDNGSTRNALIGDIVTDIILGGIGLAGGPVGAAIGTAVGGPVGAVVGEFVGGVVGNGIGIIANIDWNGDAEGGSGKDLLSDFIDNSLDFIMGDETIPEVI